MATNIEWKARVRDLPRQRLLAERLAESPPQVLDQLDTFFHVPQGYLKLRRFSDVQGELIQYSRARESDASRSVYFRVATDQPDALRDVLARALGIRGEVRKRRLLFLLGTTRIHLDDVEGLGHFLEVEVVLQAGQSEADGQRIAGSLRRQLEVGDDDLVEVAYIGLLEPNIIDRLCQ